MQNFEYPGGNKSFWHEIEEVYVVLISRLAFYQLSTLFSLVKMPLRNENKQL